MIEQAQTEIRGQLFAMAETEQQNYRERVQAMETWLKNKKMEQCRRIGSIRDLENMEARELELQNQHNCKSFKEYMRLSKK